MVDSTSSTDETCTSTTEETPSDDVNPHHAARHTSVADEGGDDRNGPNDAVSSSSSSLASRSPPPPSRILFGSCNSQYHEQPLWPNIISRNAAAFVWCGDAVYADDRIVSSSKQEDDEGKEEEGSTNIATSEPDSAASYEYVAALPSINQFVAAMKFVLTERHKVVKLDATPEYLSKLLKEQKMVPGYQELLQTNISIFGTIDDVSDFVGLLLLL